MFIFPDREDKQAQALEKAEVQVALKSTADLLAPIIKQNQTPNASTEMDQSTEEESKREYRSAAQNDGP